MHRIKDTNLLPPLFGAKNFLHLLVFLLAVAAAPVFGQGSVLTLAMVRYDKSPARTSAVAHDNSAADLLCYDASVSRPPSQAAGLKLDHQNAADFSFDSRLEKQAGSSQHDLLPLVHKKLYADGRMGKWVNVSAGYGQVCQYESGIAKNTAELQRPGFAYLRATFSF